MGLNPWRGESAHTQDLAEPEAFAMLRLKVKEIGCEILEMDCNPLRGSLKC
jgi:hypothetical protein